MAHESEHENSVTLSVDEPSVSVDDLRTFLTQMAKSQVDKDFAKRLGLESLVGQFKIKTRQAPITRSEIMCTPSKEFASLVGIEHRKHSLEFVVQVTRIWIKLHGMCLEKSTDFKPSDTLLPFLDDTKKPIGKDGVWKGRLINVYIKKNLVFEEGHNVSESESEDVEPQKSPLKSKASIEEDEDHVKEFRFKPQVLEDVFEQIMEEDSEPRKPPKRAKSSRVPTASPRAKRK